MRGASKRRQGKDLFQIRTREWGLQRASVIRFWKIENG